jgi:hypothetical protein
MERSAIRERRSRIPLQPSKTGVNALMASCELPAVLRFASQT